MYFHCSITSRFVRRYVCALLLCLFTVGFGVVSSPAQQETEATITGQVTDSAGAAVPGATVRATNTDTNQQREVQTNDDGVYTISPLNPGPYRVTVEAPSFKTFVQENLTLNAKDRRPIDATLEAGLATEVVTVTDAPALLQESPTGQALVSNTQIVELPLNNRNFLRLLEAGIPGITSDTADEVGFSATSIASYSINGLRRNSINYLIDGVNNSDVGSNITLLSTPTVDSIQEFKVLSSNYTAEIGRSGGGVVTLVTRGGGNNFRGTLYEFVRNDYFNSNSFFNNRLGRRADGALVAPVPKLRYNNFGGTISGPVPYPDFSADAERPFKLARNKTFFFFSEELRRSIRGASDLGAAVPTAAERGLTPSGNFDFSRVLAAGALLYRTPAGVVTTTAANNTPINVIDTTGNTIQARQNQVFRPSDGRAYAGNIIPRADADPRALALLGAFPLPNSPGVVNGLTASRVDVLETRQETIRIDHNFNDTNRLYGRYTHDLFETVEPGGLFFGLAIPGIATSETRVPGQVFAASYTSNFTPTFVNEATFNFSSNLIGSAVTGRARRSDYPGAETIPELFPENNQNIIPSISSRVAFIGASQGYNIAYKNSVIRDVATYINGNHTFKFGGEVSFEQKNENGSNATQGAFAFSPLQTQGFTGTQAITGTGDSLASLLLGRANTYTEAERDIQLNFRFGRREFFAQDTFKLRPNLTLDYGVRYQYFLYPTDVNNTIGTFNPDFYDRSRVVCTDATCNSFVLNRSDRLNGITLAGQNSPFGRRIAPTDRNNFSPRVGLAYSPRFESGLGRALFGGENKSVIRAGYGFYYDQPLVGIFEQPALTTRPFTDSASFTSTLTNVVTLANPAAGTPPGTLAASSGILAISPDFKTPEVQQWSLGLQREIFRNAVIDVSYVGTRGDFLIRRRNINFQLPADVARVTTQNANSVRPFLGYTAITYYETAARSRYHGFLSSFNYRFGNGFTLTAAYTFSKNLTDSTNDRDVVDEPQNPFNAFAEYAEARTSRPHVFSASYVYELPFFRTSESAALRLLFGGYQISGITNLESGAPIARVTISDTLGGQRGLYPNVVGDPSGGVAGTTDPVSGLPFIFDPSAFAPAEVGTFGNAPRSFARLPGRNQTNLSLVKNIYFNTERNLYLQLRAEGFNIFNQTQFTGLGTIVPITGLATNLTVGRPTGTRLPREFQFAAKFYF